MIVAIVDEELPYPPISGKRIRTLNLTLRLAARHQILYVCHRNADSSEAAEAHKFFTEHGIEVIFADRPTPIPTMRQWRPALYTKLALNLLSPTPYLVDANRSRALQRAVRQVVTSRPVDLWQCEWTPYAEAVRHVPGVPWVVMAHNVESVIWQRYGDHETNPWKRWYIRRQWRKFERYERDVFVNATKVVAVSETDAAIARDRLGAANVAVVDNGVDLDFFCLGEVAREVGEILFLGSLDWRPNLDAVNQLLDCIMPDIWKSEPSASLVVVGRKPPQQLVERIRTTPGVNLYSDVPDVRPFLRRATVMAVPLRVGGGSRLKILESLACELPVVSTKIGAEGLDLQPGKDLVVVDDVESMATALVRSLRSPREMSQMAKSGREVVVARYGWDALAETLSGVWEDCHMAARRSTPEAAAI